MGLALVLRAIEKSIVQTTRTRDDSVVIGILILSVWTSAWQAIALPQSNTDLIVPNTRLYKIFRTSLFFHRIYQRFEPAWLFHQGLNIQSYLLNV